MIYLSVLSFLAAILYLYVGFNTLIFNRKSKLCRIFFALSISMVIWSFAGGFLYLAENAVQYSFWNKLAAFGWCTFEALALYFVLIFTENRWIGKWYIKVLVLVPAPIFLFMVLFLFGPNMYTPVWIEKIFYIGNFLYNFIYLAISIYLVYLWGRRSNNQLRRKQSKIIALCSLMPFLLHILFGNILPALHILTLPGMGQIFTLIMFWGVHYAIIRYQFLSIPNSLITNQLFNELTGLTILTDSQGIIIKANKQVQKLLNYSQDDLLGKPFTEVLNLKELECLTANGEGITDMIKIQDVYVPSKIGAPIPFHISVIPLRTQGDLLRGFLILGEDIRATKWLQDEILRHKLTNERLNNSEILFRTIIELTPISIILISKISGEIMYLNTQAVELLNSDREDLIGSKISECFLNPEDMERLINSMKGQKKVTREEALIRRKDGSQFTGMVTMVPSIYQEVEIVLCCVIDMTQQKQVEETLKQNNENISKLNNELMILNDILVNKSVKDGLTNLFNHQYMNEVLEAKLKEIALSKEPMCIMMLDIDHFKWVNDGYGHQVGDKVLVTVADLIMKNTGSNDYIGRYGGEEFIVILTATDITAAAEIAERIRSNIQNYDFEEQDLKVTISIGVVQHGGESASAIVHKADMLLYQAKAKGRNRIEVGD